MSYIDTGWTTDGNTLTIGGVTLYTDFGIGTTEESRNWSTGRHYPLSYNGVQAVNYTHQDDIYFGAETDPAISYTLNLDDGDVNTTEPFAYNLATKLWYLPDNVYIDKVFSLEGAKGHTSDQTAGTTTYTTRMHLMSYDFTSGNANVLTNGTLLAHNSDVANGGEDKMYLSTWTVDEASVSAGKVILAFFEQPGARPEYSVNVKVKYHLV